MHCIASPCKLLSLNVVFFYTSEKQFSWDLYSWLCLVKYIVFRVSFPTWCVSHCVAKFATCDLLVPYFHLTPRQLKGISSFESHATLDKIRWLHIFLLCLVRLMADEKKNETNLSLARWFRKNQNMYSYAAGRLSLMFFSLSQVFTWLSFLR